jgi:RNA polymerase sigma factor (sigma-70 family)
VGDVGELYRLLSGQLSRIVRAGVRAPDPVIEDACQFAWGRLLRDRDRVHRDKALSWLVTTALHEALRLVDRAARDLSLEAVIEQGTDVAALRMDLPPHNLAEARERLASLASLPHRQRAALWLYGLGLSYAEIARCQGGTAHAVEHRLQRARKALRKREDAAPRTRKAATPRARQASAPGRDSARLARTAPARAAPSRRAAAAR